MPAIGPVVIALEIDSEFIRDVLRVPLVTDVLRLDDGSDRDDSHVDALCGACALRRPLLTLRVLEHHPDNGVQEILDVVLVLQHKCRPSSLAVP